MTCANCGISSNNNLHGGSAKKYCSKKCRNKATRLRRRQRPEVVAHERELDRKRYERNTEKFLERSRKNRQKPEVRLRNQKKERERYSRIPINERRRYREEYRKTPQGRRARAVETIRAKYGYKLSTDARFVELWLTRIDLQKELKA
jgi:hypothetical protein